MYNIVISEQDTMMEGNGKKLREKKKKKKTTTNKERLRSTLYYRVDQFIDQFIV